MFRTKRQRREGRIVKWTDEWDQLDGFLLSSEYSQPQDYARTSAERVVVPLTLAQKEQIVTWLDSAEEDALFAKKLDRKLGLPTDFEDKERQDYWSLNRNKAYVFVSILSLILSIIAIIVSFTK
ncbi:MAG: hypothetical protein IIA64_07895 [Planctomycetes bacterium]|nr:hypothetical protein [Planctomycetota bacterium]